MNKLPSALYSVQSVVQLEQRAIHDYAIAGYTLMRRAGQAVFTLLQQHFSMDNKILVLCGAGNNAGDGYVVARLAQQAGYAVQVVSLVATAKLNGDARQACEHWLECGDIQTVSDNNRPLPQADVIIDALLGTGLARTVSAKWAALIERVNQSTAAVIAVDIPSGLFADSGAIAGIAVRADYTVTFIGLKIGLFTGSGRACAGDIHFDALQLPADIYHHSQIDVQLLNSLDPPLLPTRPADAYKNQSGHVLIVGGNTAMAGAVILAGRAALCSGAGLVTIFTRSANRTAINSNCPELMVVGSEDMSTDETGLAPLIPESLLARITHIAIGPGLGRDDWAQQCLQQCLQADKPVVIDADALHLLAEYKAGMPAHLVLTPHPGEAAHLLHSQTQSVNADRVNAIKRLYQQYLASVDEAAVILKGSGTMIYNGKRLAICPWGNPAMATAGMGDVLTGVVVAMLAQGLPPAKAAELAVVAHAMAGDKAAEHQSRGVLASDVIAALAPFL